MIDTFLGTLAKAMSDAGLPAKFDGLYLKVGRCSFAVDSCKESRRSPGCYAVKYLGSTFKVDEEGSFDGSRAVGLTLKILPERMAELAKYDAMVDRRAALRQAFGKEVRQDQPSFVWETPIPGATVRISPSNKFMVCFEYDTVEEVNQDLSAHEELLAAKEAHNASREAAVPAP